MNVSNVTSQAKIIHTRKLGPNESIVRILSITPLIVKRLKDNPAKDRPQGNAMLVIHRFGFNPKLEFWFIVL